MKKYQFLPLLVLTLFFSCKKSSVKDFSESKDAYKYFNYFPAKTLNVTDDLFFDFTNSNINPSSMGTAKDIVKFEPSIDFDYKWTTPTTLKITPLQPLKYDKEYNVKVQLSSLFKKVEEINKSVNFKIITSKIILKTESPTLTFSNVIGDESVKIEGKVFHPMKYDTSKIKQMFQFSQANNKHLNVVWKYSYNTETRYEIINIKRYDKDTSVVKISWNGKSSDPTFYGDTNTTIPKREDFKVINITSSDESDKKIEVFFSNIVKYNQVLDGLFTVKNHAVNFKTEIEANKVTLYPEQGLPQDIELVINQLVQDKTSRKMVKSHTEKIHFDIPKPEIKDLRAGFIIPETDKMLIPFQAKNLKYVDIYVRKIFQNNVMHFLRYHDLESNYRIRRVGRTVYHSKVDLSKYSNENNTNKFVNYSIDLKNMNDKDPGCIYKINIKYKPSYVKKLDCNASEISFSDYDAKPEDEDKANRYDDEYDYDNDYDYYDDDITSNPCNGSYYSFGHFIEKTMMKTNIGIVAKQFEKNLTVVCSDINSALPMANAEVAVYDNQNQVISSKKTDDSGILVFQNLPRKTAYVISKKGRNFSYLKIESESSNSMTDFDVEGIKKTKSTDAFIYTDRGVYRPGDSIYLNTIVVDRKKALPQGHPIQIVVTDAQGHVKFDKTITQKKGNIFCTAIPTLPNDPTGNWNVTATIGNEAFSHTLKIETIKPNRLKIIYEKQDDVVDISKHNNTILNFKSRWLHGASAQGLKAEVDVKISNSKVSFEKYNSYEFNDFTRSLNGSFERVFDGKLNDDGKASYKLNLGEDQYSPGFVAVNVKTRVYEKSGNFSEDYYSLKASPYSSYVGLKMLEDKWNYPYIKTYSPISLPIISLDKDGKKQPNRKIITELYKASSSWWYEENETNELRFNSGEHIGSIEKREMTTNTNGEAFWKGSIRNNGDFLLRICDVESGHCCSQKFYVNDYQDMQSDKNNSQLTFTTDKKSYNNGEMIKIKIPSNENSRILLSLENSNGVLKTMWIEGKEGFTNVEIPASANMHPNVYIHATLIQKYQAKNNDLPLRMYGVVSVNVMDPATVLKPKLTLPSSLEPDKEYTINVKEEHNRPMTYTLAVVDEGLLDVTRFKTPDPHKHFFAKQALTVRTWDLYDQVSAVFNGKIYKPISIGGDGAIDNAALAKRAERFKPVVKFYGPFTLAGGSKNHKIKITNYVGSIRAMIVASNDKAYGSSELTVPVKKPLMVQSTLPRIVYLGDEFTITSNLFVMNKDLKTVNFKIEATPNVTFLNGNKATLAFSEKTNDDVVEFKVKANKIGKSKFTITAQSGKIITKEDIELEVINPNPLEYAVVKRTVTKSDSLPFETFGVSGSNKAVLEISNSISFNCEKRLQYLIQYPYGCLEQTTSSVFPQLYVGNILQLDKKQSNQINVNIKAGIERLASFQTYSGGFAYWPGASDINTYANSYAGHFLLEAKANGYYVPNIILNKWIEYQTNASNRYADDHNYDSYYDQVYRLYTLSLAGKPNKGAMNVMKLKNNLDGKSKNMLASAYAISDVKKTALELFSQSTAHPVYNRNSYTFHSSLIDQSIKCTALQLLDLNKEAQASINEIATSLGSEEWYSTHTTALALMAISKYNGKAFTNGIKGSYNFNGKTYDFTLTKPFTLIELPITQTNKYVVTVNNNSSMPLFAKVTYSGQRPIKENTKFFADNMIISVDYVDTENKKLDIKKLSQGKDFYAIIKLKKTNAKLSYVNLSLDYFIPTGWEIQNQRINGQHEIQSMNIAYQDIRDNAIYTFFNFNNKEHESVKIKLTASYKGKFFMPPTFCGAMYDPSIKATTSGYWVTVVESEEKEAFVSK